MDKDEKNQNRTENQKKIAYLRKYYYAKKEEQMILDEIQRLREDKMFPGLFMDGMPHGSEVSDMSEYAARMDEEMQRLKAQMLKCALLRSDISSRIRRVENDTQRELLMLRYIKCMKLEEIADEMGYSERHIRRIHSMALNSIDLKDVLKCPQMSLNVRLNL